MLHVKNRATVALCIGFLATDQFPNPVLGWTFIKRQQNLKLKIPVTQTHRHLCWFSVWTRKTCKRIFEKANSPQQSRLVYISVHTFVFVLDIVSADNLKLYDLFPLLLLEGNRSKYEKLWMRQNIDQMMSCICKVFKKYSTH